MKKWMAYKKVRDVIPKSLVFCFFHNRLTSAHAIAQIIQLKDPVVQNIKYINLSHNKLASIDELLSAFSKS